MCMCYIIHAALPGIAPGNYRRFRFNYRVSQASPWVPSVSGTLKVGGCFRNKTQRWLRETSGGGHIQWRGNIWD